MRLAFMGTPDFAVPALLALHAAGHDILAVYSQPPKPAGRGQSLRLSPVHRAAEQLGLPVRTPGRLKRDAAEHAVFAQLSLDAAVVAAYGLILPVPMLQAPVRGCLNIHASLLPRWRGAAPIQAAILAGDAESGVTIMQMEEGLDTGPMLSRASVAIGPTMDAATLHDALATLGARMIVPALEAMPTAVAQDDAASCYAPRLTREDGRIDWTQDADALDRRVRAMTPWPGAFAMFDGTMIKIAAATPLPDASGGSAPGRVLDDRLSVACGRGVLRIDRLQWPGRGMLEATAFLRGRPIPAGTILG